LRARPLDEKIAISQRFAREILPGFETGRFAPVIDARFSLDDMADAHRMMEANANFGKIAIDVQSKA
jgi:NADPH:quinone reductase-like Zn-dependent oxidoreductase